MKKYYTVDLIQGGMGGTREEAEKEGVRLVMGGDWNAVPNPEQDRNPRGVNCLC